MKAAYLTFQSGPEDLIVGELPHPRPGKGEVGIRVHATAVTPTEFDWFPTFHTRDGATRPFPIVLSHEFSGLVSEIGEGVNGWSVGQAVYGMNDWFVNGAQAEYCLAPATAIARKPDSLDDTQAAVVPISALTAWQGLFDRCQLRAGERVLVHGSAGAVGVFVVQLARWRGARVLATASSRNLEFVSALGAEKVIDYRKTPFESIARDVDVVFDCIGGQTLERSWNVLRPGGRLVAIATQSATSQEPRVRDAFFIVEPNASQLTEIASLLDGGILRSFVADAVGLDSVREAFARAKQGGNRGKVAVTVNQTAGGVGDAK